MVFKSNKKSSCVEYHQKSNSCLPCKDQEKRKKCSKLYKNYKENNTLKNRLDFYREGCFSPECYDTGHCQYLEMFDPFHPEVVEICKQSRKNVFYPFEEDEINRLDFDELEDLVNTNIDKSKGVPSLFIENVRNRLMREMNKNEIELKEVEQDQFESVENFGQIERELASLTQEYNSIVSKYNFLQNELKNRDNSKTQLKKLINAREQTIRQLNDYITRIDTILYHLNNLSGYAYEVVDEPLRDSGDGVEEFVEEIPVVLQVEEEPDVEEVETKKKKKKKSKKKKDDELEMIKELEKQSLKQVKEVKPVYTSSNREELKKKLKNRMEKRERTVLESEIMKAVKKDSELLNKLKKDVQSSSGIEAIDNIDLNMIKNFLEKR